MDKLAFYTLVGTITLVALIIVFEIMLSFIIYNKDF